MEIVHVHPMLVHFPLVLWLIGTLLMVPFTFSGADPSPRGFLTTAIFWSLLGGTLFGLAAAGFGDLALDVAKERGFPEAALEEHEETALSALWIFVAATLLYGWYFVRRMPAPRWASTAVLLLSLAGLGTALYAAFLGGNLVYGLGVNVAVAG